MPSQWIYPRSRPGIQGHPTKEAGRRTDERQRGYTQSTQGNFPGDHAVVLRCSCRLQDLVNTATTIRNDLHLTQDLKDKVDQAVEDTIVATRIIDGFRNPQSGNTYLKDHADFPMEYV